jgi:hypothetical protein
MYIDVKVEVWQRIHLNEEESVTKEKIIETITKEGVNELWELEDVDISWEFLAEAEEYLSVEKNGGQATVELYNDECELLWENGNNGNTNEV